MNNISQKTLIPIFFGILLGGITFGLIGYYLGGLSQNADVKNKEIVKIPTPTVPAKPTILQSPTTTITAPNLTPKPARKLTYHLSDGWKTSVDTNGRLEVGYNPTKYETISKPNQIELSGKWVVENSNYRRLGWNMSFYIVAYDGGSRHTAIYKALMIDPTAPIYKAPQYSEREYLFHNWHCLVISGIGESQGPVTYGLCPISSREAIFLGFDSDSWSKIEEQMSTLRLTD